MYPVFAAAACVRLSIHISCAPRVLALPASLLAPPTAHRSHRSAWCIDPALACHGPLFQPHFPRLQLPPFVHRSHPGLPAVVSHPPYLVVPNACATDRLLEKMQDASLAVCASIHPSLQRFSHSPAAGSFITPALHYPTTSEQHTSVPNQIAPDPQPDMPSLRFAASPIFSNSIAPLAPVRTKPPPIPFVCMPKPVVLSCPKPSTGPHSFPRRRCMLASPTPCHPPMMCKIGRIVCVCWGGRRSRQAQAEQCSTKI